MRQGVEEGVFARLTAALAIGGTTFIENLRRKVPKCAGGETLKKLIRNEEVNV